MTTSHNTNTEPYFFHVTQDQKLQFDPLNMKAATTPQTWAVPAGTSVVLEISGFLSALADFSKQSFLRITYGSGAQSAPQYNIYVGSGPVYMKALFQALPAQGYNITIEAKSVANDGTFTDMAFAYSFNQNVLTQEFDGVLHPDHEDIPEEGVPVDDAKYIDHLVMKRLRSLGLIDSDQKATPFTDDDDVDENWMDDDDEFDFAPEEREAVSALPPAEQSGPKAADKVSPPPEPPIAEVKDEKAQSK